MLPKEYKMYLYGSLSLKPISGLSPVELIYNQKDLLHLQMTPYLLAKKERFPEFLEEAKEYYKTCFGAEISKVCFYEEIYEAIEFYKKNMSAGKVILKPKFCIHII